MIITDFERGVRSPALGRLALKPLVEDAQSGDLPKLRLAQRWPRGEEEQALRIEYKV